MVDGIDGSGKRTIIEAMIEHLHRQGKTIFDIGEWSKKHHAIPSREEFGGAEVVIGVEPSYAWIGEAIRKELVKNGQGHGIREIAEAFALDRQVLYRRLYLPLLANGTTLITERGVSSSIVYQPAADASVTLEEILGLSGNALAMEHAPDHLVIASLDPEVALERLAKRSGKKDDAIFEKEAFLKTTHERYHSAWFRLLFEQRHARVHYLDTKGTIAEVTQSAQALLTTILTS